ncbi:MAG: SAM-dependent methyltransferase [Candidatus Pacebacteria bacterium CG_4_10_14_3_um_filter_34_15]|nr:class I SAM-dependent rRNA methyltransferase [Candidatus Paceibacterota bacterium]OIO45266.1 MAG: hypothetical protein AUJ41_00375 [Candidatus Pacebacteria bacterium CG1_02_43_31]PIQ80659.1 MAG: SAM-dependent methyltransferase [Candidatus Pacebacteria bacterium CG11_big_fil_rev_8_21_14_0_20_34_55]PIX81938.1 MAG: SAM-dependent methyltransferase [Candidatus Pacebacteria bacterium CG_4_10_14_3_um_filter_34_15]PJC43697.1 MAG: SAM-dependent methyltransferase [Candidatus Pacebacteria bacterium CG_
MNQSIIETQTAWSDYELIDTGDGERLERFGETIIVRPFPEISWSKSQPKEIWDRADAIFIRTKGDKGYWKTKKPLPESWKIHWKDLTANVYLSPFKHTGVFPEQSAHWAWMKNLLVEQKKQKPEYQPHILNLFAYTGMASIVCAKTGAKVTHVDSSRSSIGWAKQNQAASGLDERSIRWILDDVMKFVTREVKRCIKYDGIIMDPPAFGHGVTGEIWNFKSSFPKLIDLCKQILVENPLFILVNAYAVSIYPETLEKMLNDLTKKYDGNIESGELVLQESQSKKLLSTGIFARFSKK